ncbi:lysophospholipid acyltransferase family protein [Novosphingobium sp. M1R2S20]|uniref:Lysophospholipid acyltransferase family protein n=1 Tax=Novosphingobium rhizovicinum TaxID=3228928 RepID=A0ABV3R7R5_9SPHN
MAVPAGRIGPAGWLRILTRSLAGLALLIACLLVYPLASALFRRNPVPPMFLSGMLRVVGVRVRVIGERVHPPSILLANHVSWIDILALAKASGTAFVAHDGLAGHPLARFLCRLNRTVFIARHDRASVTGQITQVQSGLNESGILTLFPEGTTGDGCNLMPFKSSLLAAIERSPESIAIRPVWIDYGSQASEFAWIGDEGGLSNAKRVLAHSKPIFVAVHLLPPIGAEQRRNRKVMAEAARNAIATQMGLVSA